MGDCTDEEKIVPSDVNSAEVAKPPKLGKSSAQPSKGLGSDECVFIRNLRPAAPNMSLNSHADTRRTELYFVAAFGILLQGAVLTYDAFITYYPALRFEKDDAPVGPYAFPLTAYGTLMLVVGILLCGHVMESSTAEEQYEVTDKSKMRARILLMQQENTVSDQFFGSFAVFAQENRTTISTSSRAFQSEKGAFEGRFAAPDSSHGMTPRHFVDRTVYWGTLSEIKTVAGALISVCGFVVHFTGLRGMHWSASVANLGAILLMTALRAFVRRKLVDSFTAKPLRSSFEIDRLSTTLSEPRDPRDHQKPEAHFKRTSHKSQGEMMSSGAYSDKPNEWTICTWESSISLDEDKKSTKVKDKGCSLHRKVDEAYGVMMLRRDLALLADWRGPAAKEAIHLAQAIETTLNTLLPNPQHSWNCSWSLKVQRDGPEMESLVFRLDWYNGTWHAHADELEAALSLWLYSAATRDDTKRVPRSHSITGDDSWLRGREQRHNTGIRLLGPYEDALVQDLKRWMQDGLVGFVKAEECGRPRYPKRSSLRDFEVARTAASGRAGWATNGRVNKVTPQTEFISSLAASEKSWWNLDIPKDWEVGGTKHDEDEKFQFPDLLEYIATTSNEPLEKFYVKDIFPPSCGL